MFRYYADAPAVVTALASFAAAVVGFGLAFRSGALMMATPEHVAGIWGLHFRFGPALLILLAAPVRFAQGAVRAPAIGAGLLGAVLLAQVHHAGARMASADTFHDRLRADLAVLPKGARLLQAFEPGMSLRLANHAGAPAVIEADAFVPTLFTNTSPVGVRPEWRAPHLPAGSTLDLPDLDSAANAAPPDAENGLWAQNYFDARPAAFTHVLYMRMAGGPPPPLKGAAPLLARPDYVLYAGTKNHDGAP